MASSSASNSNAIPTCEACSKKFSRLIKIVPDCGYSICGECYGNLRDNVDESSGNYTCPACNERHRMPERGLPNNKTLEQLLNASSVINQANRINPSTESAQGNIIGNEPRLILTGHTKAIHQALFLPNGRLASCSKDKTIKIWNTDTGAMMFELAGFDSPIYSLAWLPSGLLASGYEDGAIRLWDLATRSVVRTLTGHQGRVITLKPLGQSLLASYAYDGRMKIWDPSWDRNNMLYDRQVESMHYMKSSFFEELRSGHVLIIDHENRFQSNKVVHFKAYEPLGGPEVIAKETAIACDLFENLSSYVVLADGRIAYCENEGTIQLIDLTDERETRSWPHPYETSQTALLQLPDGNLLSSGSVEKAKLMHVWSLESGELLQTIKCSDTLEKLCLSLDQKTIAGMTKNSIVLWQYNGRVKPEEPNSATSDEHRTIISELSTLTPHTSGVQTVVFLPDGHVASCAFESSQVKIWRPQDGANRFNLETNVPVRNAIVLPNGLLAFGHNNGTISLWNDRTQLKTLNGGQRMIYSFQVLKNGRFASYSACDTICIWRQDAAEQRPILTIEGQKEYVNPRLGILSNGSLVTVFYDRDSFGSKRVTYRIWNPDNGQLVKSVPIRSATPHVFLVLSDDRIAEGFWNGSIRLIDLTDLSRSRTIDLCHKLGVNGLVQLPSGYLASIGADDAFKQTIRVWDVESGRLLQTVPTGHSEKIMALSVSEDGTLLASGSWDHSAKIWRLSS